MIRCHFRNLKKFLLQMMKCLSFSDFIFVVSYNCGLLDSVELRTSFFKYWGRCLLAGSPPHTVAGLSEPGRRLSAKACNLSFPHHSLGATMCVQAGHHSGYGGRMPASFQVFEGRGNNSSLPCYFFLFLRLLSVSPSLFHFGLLDCRYNDGN